MREINRPCRLSVSSLRLANKKFSSKEEDLVEASFGWYSKECFFYAF